MIKSYFSKIYLQILYIEGARRKIFHLTRLTTTNKKQESKSKEVKNTTPQQKITEINETTH